MKAKGQTFSDQVFQRVQQRVQQHGQGEHMLRKYKGLCKRSGGMLRTVGLIQFLTFLEARGNREPQHHELLDDLRVSAQQLGILQNSDNRETFLKRVRELTLPKYMHLTRETLRLLDWHKRLGDILIEGNAEEHDQQED